MHWKLFRALLFSAAVCAAVPCRAAVIDVQLASSALTGTAGTAVTFSGTIFNPGVDLAFLNGAGVNLTGLSPADADVGPFFLNAPLFVNPLETTLSIDLFTITIPAATPDGLYPGTFTVLGGVDDSAQDVLSTVDFTVQVGSASVPEPDSLWFLAGALPALALTRLRRGTIREL